MLRDGVADNRPVHIDSHLGIRPAREARDRLAVELRPTLRHVETAIARQTREHHLDEAERLSLTAGGDVTHGLPGSLLVLRGQRRPIARRAYQQLKLLKRLALSRVAGPEHKDHTSGSPAAAQGRPGTWHVGW